MQDGALAAQAGMFMILTAAAVNNVVKAGLALSGGPKSYGLWVTAGLVAGLVFGALAALVIHFAPLVAI